MLVTISLVGKNQMIGQVRVKKFDDATTVAQWYADKYQCEVIMFDVHGVFSKIVGPTRAGQVESGDGGPQSAGATAGSGDTAGDGHG